MPTTTYSRILHCGLDPLDFSRILLLSLFITPSERCLVTFPVSKHPYSSSWSSNIAMMDIYTLHLYFFTCHFFLISFQGRCCIYYTKEIVLPRLSKPPSYWVAQPHFAGFLFLRERLSSLRLWDSVLLVFLLLISHVLVYISVGLVCHKKIPGI